MYFGYCIENFGPELTPDKLINTAKKIEQAGFHSIWTTDHIMIPKGGPIPVYENFCEPITTLAFLASHTNTIKLGVSTLILPLRNPILVSKQLAMVDYLSKGRLINSFGAGWVEGEFQFMNKNFKDRGKRFNKDIELLKTLWKGENTFQGEYSFDNASFIPLNEELQDSLFLISGISKLAIERAIKYGNGWHPAYHFAQKGLTGEQIESLLEPYSAQLENRKFEIWVRVITDTDNFDEMTKDYLEHNIKGLIWDLTQGDPSTLQDRKKKLIDFVNNY